MSPPGIPKIPKGQECGRVLTGGFAELRCHATKGLCERCGHCFWGTDMDYAPDESTHCTCDETERLMNGFGK